MYLDKKLIIIIVQSVVIAGLLLYIFQKDKIEPVQDDAYVQQLIQQNKELEAQITRLKKNFVDIGILDSTQTANIDSLILISQGKINDLKEEARVYRATLEGMKSNDWNKLSNDQKQKEIEEALNFLKNNEN